MQRGSARPSRRDCRARRRRGLGALLVAVGPLCLIAAEPASALTLTANRIAATEGAAFGGTVASFTDVALLGCSPDSYQAGVAWADGSTSGANVSTVSEDLLGCTYRVSAGHVFAEEGSQSFRVSASGGLLLGSASATGTAAIADAPVRAAAVAINVAEAESFGTTIATFTDADPGGASGDYSATVTWGDGTNAAATVAADPSGGFDVFARHAYAQPGAYAASVSIADGGGSHTAVGVAATVGDAPLSAAGVSVSATEGAHFQAGLASFSDPDTSRPSSHYAASVAWGDGTPLQNATIAADGPGHFTVAGDHTYLRAGRHAATVTITDPGGARTTAPVAVNVADAPLHASATNHAADAGTPLRGTFASFSDADPNATAANFTATIAWGDGASTIDPTIAASPAGGFTVAATHTYQRGGSFTATVTITDNGGGSASATSTVAVAGGPSPQGGSGATQPTGPSSANGPGEPLPSLTQAASTALTAAILGVSAPRLNGPSKLALLLHCPTSTARCRGVARVITLPARSRRSRLRGGTSLGSALFLLKSGESKTVLITIPKRLRQALRLARSAHLAGVAIAFGTNGRNLATTGPTAVISTLKLR